MLSKISLREKLNQLKEERKEKVDSIYDEYLQKEQRLIAEHTNWEVGDIIEYGDYKCEFLAMCSREISVKVIEYEGAPITPYLNIIQFEEILDIKEV